VKLIDFGIAKAAGKASTTQAGILKGKFGYMSPEQVRGLPIDKRSDIFAVGIVLYELLTGERLFVGETDFSTLEKVRNVEIVPPSAYNKKISPELERLILKALARDPEDRYSNAIDLHDDLQSFLYSIGEFYSRKDLAAWMKKTFAIEIEEDNSKLEQHRQVAPPVAAAAEVSRRAAVGAGARTSLGIGGGPPPMPTAARAGGQHQMSWDDEELDTQIFDKEPTEQQAGDRTPADLFFEDDDRTVATEPDPEILEQARPPDSLATPRPEPTLSITLGSEDLPAPTPPPAARPAPAPARRPTLTGIPAPAVSRTLTRPPAPPPMPASAQPTPPPTPPPLDTPPPPSLRRSGMNLPPVHRAPTPSTALPALSQMPAHTQQMHNNTSPRLSPRQSFAAEPAYAPAPFGAGSFNEPVAPPPPRKRGGALAVAVILVLAVAGGGFWYYSTTNRPGRIEVSATPADATVLVDNTKVGDKSPVSFDRPPGPYTLSVTRDGYVRSDQNIEVRAGQRLPLTVALEPSPDTGFEFTSEPPGGLVWLDGAPIKGAGGQQARTDFRAFRITPGHHVLEIKGEDRFKPWRQDVDVQPGGLTKVHAMLVPSSGGGSSASSKSAPAPSTPKSAPAPSAPVAPPPPAAEASAGATEKHGGGGGGHRRRNVTNLGNAAVADEDTSDNHIVSISGDNNSAECSITVNSVPWSEVWIDGKNTNQHTPLVDFKVPCGKHKLNFKRDDMQIDHLENISVKPGGKFKQRYTLATDQ
jgi:hypothetical protein